VQTILLGPTERVLLAKAVYLFRRRSAADVDSIVLMRDAAFFHRNATLRIFSAMAMKY